MRTVNTRISSRDPRPLAKCDQSNMIFFRDELVKDMQFIGNKLQWTGNLVYYKFVDKPNPQGIPIKLRPDPMPVVNPRPLYFPELPPIPEDLAVEDFNETIIILNWTPVKEAQNYVIYWRNNFINTNTLIMQPNEVVSPPWVIEGFMENTTYIFTIASINSISDGSFNVSGQSPPLTVTTLSS